MQILSHQAEANSDAIYDYWLEHYHRACNGCASDHEPEDCKHPKAGVEKLTSPQEEDYPMFSDRDYDLEIKDEKVMQEIC